MVLSSKIPNVTRKIFGDAGAYAQMKMLLPGQLKLQVASKCEPWTSSAWGYGVKGPGTHYKLEDFRPVPKLELFGRWWCWPTNRETQSCRYKLLVNLWLWCVKRWTWYVLGTACRLGDWDWHWIGKGPWSHPCHSLSCLLGYVQITQKLEIHNLYTRST